VSSTSFKKYIHCTGADPGFQVRGDALKKIAPSGGRQEKFWEISCEKSRFYTKNSYFFQLRGRHETFWGISCEKSRFYANKSYFFQLRREAQFFFWVFRVKNHDFTPKNHIFSNFRGGTHRVCPLHPDPPLWYIYIYIYGISFRSNIKVNKCNIKTKTSF
jgi:hypothetical protein